MKKIHRAKDLVLPFILVVTIALSLVFVIHLFVLNKLDLPLFSYQLIEAYIANGLLAIVIFTTLFLLRKKYHEQLGFLFMAGSLLKFAVFFIFFYAGYQLAGSSSKVAFFAFFVPYITSLLTETLGLIKLLNLPKNE
ncbi:hypothetical protein GCM10011416_07370 [Polaribacter pacificus]|uniref:Uncharacterized protein n=1 Tax=Polaribacter pacificus TaxID=1775173 RepID=A0A917MED4_9FLAO|nr:DUF6168 family protein [Polaribacter pacificus]GGG92874.1 hypothetical protein GCM10011416_07370 [Polaribacter pacificus]